VLGTETIGYLKEIKGRKRDVRDKAMKKIFSGPKLTKWTLGITE